MRAWDADPAAYTALTQPVPTPPTAIPASHGANIRRRATAPPLPMTLPANHALADGIHMAHFFTHPEAEMARLAAVLRET